MYINFLKKYKVQYNLVFSVDVRDTFFQKDVFKFYENNTSFLGIAIEDGTLDDYFSKTNIINLIGAENHSLIHNERIICMGTLWGSIDKFLEFSIIMWEKINIYKFPRSDQSIANCLLYHENFLKDFIVKSDNYGPVMTIGLTEREKVKIDSKENILNFRGEIASVVHQYDRKDDIKKIILRRFCSKLSCKTILIYNFINISNNNFNKTIQIVRIRKNNYENITFFNIFGTFIIILMIKSIYNNNSKKVKKFIFSFCKLI